MTWLERDFHMWFFCKGFFTGGSFIMICFSFCLLQMLTGELEWCGLLWCFYQLFGLSFWRHPFTAEHPLLRHWCRDTFSVNSLFWVNCSFKFLDWKQLKLCKASQKCLCFYVPLKKVSKWCQKDNFCWSKIYLLFSGSSVRCCRAAAELRWAILNHKQYLLLEKYDIQ